MRNRVRQSCTLGSVRGGVTAATVTLHGHEPETADTAKGIPTADRGLSYSEAAFAWYRPCSGTQFRCCIRRKTRRCRGTTRIQTTLSIRHPQVQAGIDARPRRDSCDRSSGKTERKLRSKQCNFERCVGRCRGRCPHALRDGASPGTREDSCRVPGNRAHRKAVGKSFERGSVRALLLIMALQGIPRAGPTGGHRLWRFERCAGQTTRFIRSVLPRNCSLRAESHHESRYTTSLPARPPGFFYRYPDLFRPSSS